MAGLKQQYKVAKELEALTEVAQKAVKQLVTSKATLADYQKRIKAQDVEAHKAILDSCKATTKEVTKLIDLFLGKEDDRQGIVRNPELTVMTRIGLASRYVNSRPDGITSTEGVLMQHARTATSAALEKVNDFYANQWPMVKKEIESIELSGFKPVEQFTIKE